MRKDEKFVAAFSELRRNWELTGEIATAPEKYLCTLYGSKENSVDAARRDMFMKKQTKENKVIDLSVIPPCFTSLYLQMKRANYVAVVWKRREHPQMLFPRIEEHGWQADCSINWIEEQFPDGISDLLYEEDEYSYQTSDDENDKSDIYGSETESDNDC